jgi:uncharacterized GH25 family protein
MKIICPRMIVALLVMLLSTVAAHDLFLKFETYFLKPNARAEVRLLNGEFNKSENSITRDRMRDVSIVSPAETTHPPESDWRDEGNFTVLKFRTGQPGTYVIGTSTRPRELTMKAAEFNRYLQLEGVIDTFLERRKNGKLQQSATERYSKHVKALFQVGDERTEAFKTALDYPVEIIPQQNPYQLKTGDSLDVRCLREGHPIHHQYVLYGWQAAGQKTFTLRKTRTDPNGVARIPLTNAGRWYIKFIHMAEVNEATVSYESNWATLTFEMRR